MMVLGGCSRQRVSRIGGANPHGWARNMPHEDAWTHPTRFGGRSADKGRGPHRDSPAERSDGRRDHLDRDSVPVARAECVRRKPEDRTWREYRFARTFAT
jgi:hypothetical protein